MSHRSEQQQLGTTEEDLGTSHDHAACSPGSLNPVQPKKTASIRPTQVPTLLRVPVPSYPAGPGAERAAEALLLLELVRLRTQLRGALLGLDGELPPPPAHRNRLSQVAAFNDVRLTCLSQQKREIKQSGKVKSAGLLRQLDGAPNENIRMLRRIQSRIQSRLLSLGKSLTAPPCDSCAVSAPARQSG